MMPAPCFVLHLLHDGHDARPLLRAVRATDAADKPRVLADPQQQVVELLVLGALRGLGLHEGEPEQAFHVRVILLRGRGRFLNQGGLRSEAFPRTSLAFSMMAMAAF